MNALLQEYAHQAALRGIRAFFDGVRHPDHFWYDVYLISTPAYKKSPYFARVVVKPRSLRTPEEKKLKGLLAEKTRGMQEALEAAIRRELQEDKLFASASKNAEAAGRKLEGKLLGELAVLARYMENVYLRKKLLEAWLEVKRKGNSVVVTFRGRQLWTEKGASAPGNVKRVHSELSNVVSLEKEHRAEPLGETITQELKKFKLLVVERRSASGQSKRLS